MAVWPLSLPALCRVSRGLPKAQTPGNSRVLVRWTAAEPTRTEGSSLRGGFCPSVLVETACHPSWAPFPEPPRSGAKGLCPEVDLLTWGSRRPLAQLG